MFNNLITTLIEDFDEIAKQLKGSINYKSFRATRFVDEVTEGGETDSTTWQKTTYTDTTGLIKFVVTTVKNKEGYKVNTTEELVMPTENELNFLMAKHSANQEFEKAAAIRDLIKNTYGKKSGSTEVKN